MQRTTLSGMIVSLLLFCCGGVLLGSDADELRERAKALQKKASISAEQGKPDQAERLERESADLLEAAERLDLKAKGSGEPGIDKEVRHLKDRLQDLRAKEQKMREANAPEKELAEVRQQVAGTDRELHLIHAHHAGKGKLPPDFHAQAEKIAAASRRIHHLRVAAQNLKMADAHDLAHQLREKAEAMEREVQEGKQRLAAEIQQVHGGEHGPVVVRDLKEEIERLRAEVKELRQKVEKR